MQPDARDPDDAEERAWRAIVDNYGDRAELDADLDAEVDDPPADSTPVTDAPFGGRFGDPRRFDVPDEDLRPEPEEEGFVPPPPPPLPRLAPDRLAAWVGIFGSPAVLVLALILQISIPPWLGYLLIAGFVGGFLYLVLRMSREPRDPWDDGAQV